MRLFPWLDGHQVFAGLADGLTSVFLDDCCHLVLPLLVVLTCRSVIVSWA